LNRKPLLLLDAGGGAGAAGDVLRAGDLGTAVRPTPVAPGRGEEVARGGAEAALAAREAEGATGITSATGA
jgi:hypothetical protein